VNAFLRLLRHAAPYRGRLTVALLAMIVYAAGSVGIVTQVGPIFDGVLPAGASLPRVAALLLGAYLLKGAGAYVSGYSMTYVGQRVVMNLRTRLYGHILNQSAAFFARRTSGQLMSRITNDVAQVQQAVAETVADLVRESLAVVGYTGYLFFIDWRLALVCLCAAPLVIYPLARLGQRVRSTTRRSQEDLEQLTHVANEGLAGHRIVKAFRAEPREVTRFEQATERLFRTTMRVVGAVAVLPPLMEFVGGLAAVAALWYGSRQVALGELSTGEFAAFLTAAFMMYAPVKKLSRVNAGLQQAIAASERIFGMLDTHTEVQDRPGAPPLAPLRQAVIFDDVGFAYEDDPDRFILRHVSFRASAGQVVAIVGLSGAGKTTLVNLIPRFYDVTEGAIRVDGVDIRDVALGSLRDQIALVTQETVLFDDTVAANIAYGRPTASAEAIAAAARAAHAHEFIARLPRGYDTSIGERGQRLSGGQRQRLAIARALLKDSPLLVLDEATSSLDAESEQLVQDALQNLMRDRTTFVIAHRLSTVRRADLIVALEHGRVAEVGTHESLVSRPGGVYAKLYALQAFDDAARSGAGGEPDDEGEGDRT
jgi:subfamily B ATP-binding cassette protein MsbA